MKKAYKFLAVAALLLASCNDYLDKEPLSDVSSDIYFSSDSQLDAYVMEHYPDLWNHKLATGYGTLTCCDEDTDDKTSQGAEAVPMFSKGGAGVTVPSSGGVWDFKDIRSCNYFFEKVLPKYEAGVITGNPTYIKQYIGEMYFFRAYEYFDIYSKIGDMPIITTVPGMDFDALAEMSIRQPRCEVARFILDDLDKAIELLSEVSTDGMKNRLNKNAARLFKSRVALFEGSWLLNFANTAFVPNGPEWPGADMYPGYSFQAGSLQDEAEWFLQQAVDASEVVADNVPLTPQNSTKSRQQDSGAEANPYYDMFSQDNLSSYDEIIVWRSFNKGFGTAYMHGTSNGVACGNYEYGTTKGIVDSYLMSNGLPIYAADSGYKGEETIFDEVTERDPRLRLWLKVPGDVLKVVNHEMNTTYKGDEPYPQLFTSGANAHYNTGYAICKHGSLDGAQFIAMTSYSGSVVFRGGEAYLNYLEASYLLNGSVTAKAAGYWKALRERAGVDPDFNKTIAATDMSKEAEGDFGAYTAGELVDATLYNIRRERRNELISEGFRMNDLRRWRSMDQLVENPFHIRGMKFWNTEMKDLIINGSSDIEGMYGYGGDESVILEFGVANSANISSRNDGDYILPYRVSENNENFDGFTWQMPHYLTPIAANHFTVLGGDETFIYQNPGWGITGGSNAE